jgi:RNA polymerase subunit RPABC4/transcription elongation factor Spt4
MATESSADLYCVRCGTFTPATEPVCSHCGHDGPPFRGRSTAARFHEDAVERPGCVTAYVILSVVGTVFLIGLLVFAAGLDLDPDLMSVVWLAALIGTPITLLAAWGLWRMRNWARWIVLITTGLSMTADAFEVLAGDASSVISLLVGGIIVYWFKKNADKFTP